MGPVATQARRVVAALDDPRHSAVVAVAVPEETPVNETLELSVKVRDQLGHAPVAVVANAVIRDALSAARIAELDDVLPKPVLRALRARHERARLHAAQLRRLRRGLSPVLTLPHLGRPIGQGEIAELSALLARELG